MRIGLITVVFWSLLAEPMLCGNGLLGCGDDDEPMGCTHQSCCQNDACSQAVVARRVGTVDDLTVPPALPAIAEPPMTPRTSEVTVGHDARAFEDLGDVCRPGDLPLRI